VTGRAVWFAVPAGFDDPVRVSGGNVYDRRVIDELEETGWSVHTTEIGPDAAADAAARLARVPDGALVLVDGLIAVRQPEAVVEASARCRVVVVAHMVVAGFADAAPEAIAAERRALCAAHHVIATSAWASERLIELGICRPGRSTVAVPGTDPAPAAAGTADGGALLCVGVVAPHKGQDTLIDALAGLRGAARWTCTIAGSVATDPEFAERVARRVDEAGLASHVRWAGVLGRDRLDAAYAGADLVVAPSRTESYGMAVADALRRGIPVVATRTGGIPEAVAPGDAAILVPPDRPDALRDALRRWMTEPALRERLTTAARRGREDRPSWRDTARSIHSTLEELS